MAGELAPNDISEQLELITAARADITRRVIERAEQRAIQAGRRQARVTEQSLNHGSLIASVLAIAMTQLDRIAWNRPSIRVIAPDTGGRTFHLKYEVITKGQRKRSTKAAGDKSRVSSTCPPSSTALLSKQGLKTSFKEVAHQQYVEREEAVFSTVTVESLHSQEGKASEEFMGLANGRESFTGVYTETMQVGSATSAQTYIENSRKTLFGHSASFGTIGENAEARIEFWELVNQHESHCGGRTQSRLVLELPHEASADQRHEIVRRITDAKFLAKGIPFWAAIHSPTKDNDTRNFHAHIVYVERPMARMAHPNTGQIVWDFTVAVRFRDKTRHTRTRYPYRQNRDPGMREKGWLAQTRRDYSDIVNAIMCVEGEPALYDPRSYKDMGLDVEPMPSIIRITAEKIKGGKHVVLDPKRAAALADREIKQAANRRLAAVKQFNVIEQHVRRGACNLSYAERVRPKLPAHLRIEAGPGRAAGSTLGKVLVDKILSVERDRQRLFLRARLYKASWKRSST